MATHESSGGGTWRMVAAMAISGTIGLVVVESGQAPLTVVFFRCLVGGAGLLAWLLARRAWRPLSMADLGWLLLGGLSLVANWLCLFSSYRYASISVATVVYQTQPFMLLVLAALLYRERIAPGRLPWLALAMVGVLLSSGLEWGHAEHAPRWQGVALACAAALLYAISTLATQRLKHLPSAQIAAVQMGFGVIALAPLALPLGTPLTPKGMAALATAGLVHTAFMYTLMYAAFQRLSSQAIAALSFVYPAVALLVDLVWFGAVPGPLQWLGMALIVLTVIAHRRDWDMLALLKAHKPKIV
jgi:drug/metabolite transporter (DMT)-like permease